jgi:hypothetical protein
MFSQEHLHLPPDDPTDSRFAVLLGIIGLVCALAVGCGGPKLPQVTGKVTVDGQPAEGAVLIFFPEDSTTSSVASAVSSSDGTFQLVSDMNSGIAIGRYNVSISWPDPSKKPTERETMMGNFEPGRDLLNARYASKDTSGLTAEITALTTELASFELSTK